MHLPPLSHSTKTNVNESLCREAHGKDNKYHYQEPSTWSLKADYMTIHTSRLLVPRSSIIIIITSTITSSAPSTLHSGMFDMSVTTDSDHRHGEPRAVRGEWNQAIRTTLDVTRHHHHHHVTRHHHHHHVQHDMTMATLTYETEPSSSRDETIVTMGRTSSSRGAVASP